MDDKYFYVTYKQGDKTQQPWICSEAIKGDPVEWQIKRGWKYFTAILYVQEITLEQFQTLNSAY